MKHSVHTLALNELNELAGHTEHILAAAGLHTHTHAHIHNHTHIHTHMNKYDQNKQKRKTYI